MTEMVYGTDARTGGRAGASALVAHHRPLVAGGDLRCSSASACCSGSPPRCRWPRRNGLDPFYYVTRQAFFGARRRWSRCSAISMMSPRLVRRLGVLGFVAAFVALLLLPVFGTDFGKGAVRWYSLGFASLQPSEFLKPVFVDRRRLADGREHRDRTARRARRMSFVVTLVDGGAFWRCSRISARPRWSCSPGA